jgi:hypothetical protein
VAKKLGADSLLEWLNSGAIPQIRAERVETSRGYRILRVARA